MSTPASVSIVPDIKIFVYVWYPTPVSVIPLKENIFYVISIVCMKERFDSLSTLTRVSVISVEEEVWLCDHSCSCVCYSFWRRRLAVWALLFLDMLFLLRDRFGYVSTPDPAFIIPFEGEICLCEYSYSCVNCLCKREVWLFEYSYSCVYGSCWWRDLDVWAFLLMCILFVWKRGLVN